MILIALFNYNNNSDNDDGNNFGIKDLKLYFSYSKVKILYGKIEFCSTFLNFNNNENDNDDKNNCGFNDLEIDIPILIVYSNSNDEMLFEICSSF